MSIYWSRSFPRSNSSFLLSSGYASKSSVIRLREDKFLVDTGLGTPKIRMTDELTKVPQYRRRTARFENKVGYSFNVVAGESTLKKRRNYEIFFKDLVAGESRIKERAAANLNSFLGSLDVAAGEPLVLPRRFRQNRAWIELQKIWRTNKNKLSLIRRTIKKAKGSLIRLRRTKKKAKGSLIRLRRTIKKAKGFLINKAKRKKRKGYSVAIAGFITFLPVFKKKKKKGNNKKPWVKKKKLRRNAFSKKRHLFTY